MRARTLTIGEDLDTMKAMGRDLRTAERRVAESGTESPQQKARFLSAKDDVARRASAVKRRTRGDK
jgi:hypothetical protein